MFGAGLQPTYVRAVQGSERSSIRAAASISPPTPSPLKGVGWATVVSVALHATAAWMVLRAPVGSFGAHEVEPDSVEIDIVAPPIPEVQEPPVAEPEPEALEPEPEPLPDDAVVPPPTPAAQIERPRGEPSPNVGGEPGAVGAGEPVPSTIEVPQVTPDAPRPETDAERRRRLQALLNPASVARGGFVATGPGPSRTGPPAGLGGTGDPGPSEAEIEANLSAGLRREALARAYLARTEPELTREPDGSLAYRGHRFTARIRPDGSVSFEDSPNVQTNGFSTSGTMDITEAFMNAGGQDPHFAEREWFMRHTREVRERLEDEHRAQQMSASLRGLRGRLSRILATTSRTYAARRQRIFSIWDDMAEDSDGARARRIVIRFIREELPQGSENAYTDAEIDRLNATRESTEAFAPY